MSNKHLILVDGRKGGTGRSTVTMALIERLSALNAQVRAYDLDGASGDTATRYDEHDRAVPLACARIDQFGPIYDDMHARDGAIDIAVVDVAARSADLLEQFLVDAGPLHAAEAGTLSISVLWVVASAPRLTDLDAAKARWERVGLPVTIALVLNEGLARRFDYVTDSATGQRLIAAGVTVHRFPELPEEVAQEVASLSIPFGEYVSTATARGHAISDSRRAIARTWLARTGQALAAIPSMAPLFARTAPVAIPVPVGMVSPAEPTPKAADAVEPADPYATDAEGEPAAVAA